MSESKFRKYMRVLLPIVVEVQFEGEEEIKPFMITDISWGGVFLRAENPRPIGNRLTVHLPIVEDSVALEIQGAVIKHNKTVEGELIPGMAVEFDALDDEAKGEIQKLANRILRQQQKN